ncbi:hypothetical protein N7495_004642 [Penicillium taxi]|uniref:uncharacterized protein n=1 Tax=Penicillium taxi TaxID=168475 RepID=UPI0025459B29|nr:uncharacterized protein N7495_004642 [Penicillium taxi]KAJ5899898.1 hypothetical protein N7495_004642 [Penicillium taxi]
MSTFSSPDFLLFPSNSTIRSKMLESQKQYFQPMMDPMVDTFYPVDMNSYPNPHPDTDYSRVPPYYDPSVFETDFKISSISSFPSMPATPPSISLEPQMPTGSIASGSAPSSAIGSPYSGSAQLYQDNWVNTNHGLGLPAAVMSDLFVNEYPVDSEGLFQGKFPDTFVDLRSNRKLTWAPLLIDPSLIQPVQSHNFSPSIPYEQHQNNSTYSLVPSDFLPYSPAISPVPYSDNVDQQYTSPMMMPARTSSRLSVYDRRSSISSTRSRRSRQSPALSSVEVDDEVKEKGRCPHPDCGRVFKDLKAHTLTHQSERPEKCPIMNCEYHTKGFARKYDKNRHTLTHYKGTMVCGFCPGPGSPAEKSFNRADVFKRHLTAVHGVEQTAPNCRNKRNSSASTKQNTGTNYSSDGTGKCSTCSSTFSNVQDFYEHLDDCVLRVVQQEEPSEAINQQRLAEVASDDEVRKTMEKHQLHNSAGSEQFDDNDSHDDDDFLDPSLWRGAARKGTNSFSSSRVILGAGNAVTKNSSTASRTAHSRRRTRGTYPQDWSCPSSNIKTKKRVLCVFNGSRRLWKDEMRLNNEFEVRLRFPGDDARETYVTDLDIMTLKRAEGVLSTNDEERGPWINDLSHQIMGQPAILLSDMCRGDDEIPTIDELMA